MIKWIRKLLNIDCGRYSVSDHCCCDKCNLDSYSGQLIKAFDRVYEELETKTDKRRKKPQPIQEGENG